MDKKDFFSFFWGNLEIIGSEKLMGSEGSVVFYSSIIYSDYFGFLLWFTNPKSKDFLPFSRLERAGAWGPISENMLSYSY